MSLRTIISLANSSTGQNCASSVTRTPAGAASNGGVLLVGTGDETIPISADIVTPQEIFVKNISGDDVLVGFDGAVYPLRLKATMAQIVAINSGIDMETGGSPEIPGEYNQTVIAPIADVASSLQDCYFILDCATKPWCLWFNISGGAAPSLGAGYSYLEITGFSADDTAEEIAAAIRACMDASTAFEVFFTFSCPVPSIVLVTELNKGVRDPVVDTGTWKTNFAFYVSKVGAAFVAEVEPSVARVAVHVKSEGTSTVSYAVFDT